MQTRNSYIIFLLAALLLTAAPAVCADQSDSIRMANASQLADSLETVARSFLGKPYHHGATGPGSFDCSGFTSFIYSKFGYNLTHSSSSQALQGRAIPAVKGTDYSQRLQKGDIVVFNGRKISKTRVGHVGIFLDADTVHHCFRFIHAAVHGGVIISRSNEPYYAARFLFARRFLPDFNGVATFADSTVVTIYGDTVNAEIRDTIVDSSIPADTIKVSTQQAETTYHKVKQGDTLYSLARRYGTTVSKICQLNNIRESSVLQIGQRLRMK